MKKLFSLAASLASVAFLTSSAWAIDTNKAYDITISNGPKNDIDVGTLYFELEEEVGGGFNASCRYFTKWTNNAVLKSSANLTIDEWQTVGQNDCWENSTSFVDAAIVLGPGKNYGFDKFQQKRVITFLACAEDEWNGECDGVIQINGGVLYHFAFEPKP